jgi:hypothetical protein
MRLAAGGTQPAPAGRLARLSANYFDQLLDLQCLCDARERLSDAESEDRLEFAVHEGLTG